MKKNIAKKVVAGAMCLGALTCFSLAIGIGVASAGVALPVSFGLAAAGKALFAGAALGLGITFTVASGVTAKSTAKEDYFNSVRKKAFQTQHNIPKFAEAYSNFGALTNPKKSDKRKDKLAKNILKKEHINNSQPTL